MTRSLLPALLAAMALAGYALWLYRRRELPIRGRAWLAALRAAALVLLVALLWNPQAPALLSPGEEAPVWIALDASRSMAGAVEGATPWSRALALVDSLVDSLGGGAQVVLMDDPPQPVGEVGSLSPGSGRSVLAPALRRAAEAGASEVIVLSDLRLSDPVAIAAELPGLGLDLTVLDLGGEVSNAGIGALDVPETGRTGERIEVSVEVVGSAAVEGDSATLLLSLDERVLSEWRVALAGPGATVRRSLEAALPAQAGDARWRASLSLDGDGFADDDARTRITRVDPAVGLLALVSLSPDWEPRFLLPVLEEVTGLPARGWLAIGPDRYLPMRGGAVVTGAQLRPQLEDARLLVLHGLATGAPAWLLGAATRARRLLAFPSDAGAAQAIGLTVDPPRSGEWFLAAPPPPSPLAGSLAGPLAESLAGQPLEGLPPLSNVLALRERPPTDVVPLELESSASPAQPRAPALVLLDREDRRVAVALAEGYWRWAFRTEGPREVYRRLWSGVAGWLLDFGQGRRFGGVAPSEAVVAADGPVVWDAPDAAGGRLEVVLTGEATRRVDTLSVPASGIAVQRDLAEGDYLWEARALGPDSAADERVWTGALSAETWTDDLHHGRIALDAGLSGSAERPRAGRPLRESPWVYLLMLALLSMEWIARRRSGLR